LLTGILDGRSKLARRLVHLLLDIVALRPGCTVLLVQPLALDLLKIVIFGCNLALSFCNEELIKEAGLPIATQTLATRFPTDGGSDPPDISLHILIA
jgi:hypothetical protein